MTLPPIPPKLSIAALPITSLEGRHHDIAVFETPKNTGEKIGEIVRVTNETLEVKSRETIHNADGLTYLTRERKLMGFAVNRAEEIQTGLWRLTLRERPILKKHPQLAPGLTNIPKPGSGLGRNAL